MNALMRKKFKLKPPNLHNDHEKNMLLLHKYTPLFVSQQL
jgi:hypothetical protein